MAVYPQAIQSFGNALSLRDAALEIGRRFPNDWSAADETALRMRQSTDNIELARQRLKAYLAAGRVAAYGCNDEGAVFSLERERLSSPFFDLRIEDSSFLWAPNEWDTIYVDQPSLLGFLASIVDAKPRRTPTYDWRSICVRAVELAANNRTLRNERHLVTQLQIEFESHKGAQPDRKELAPLVRDILAALSQGEIRGTLGPFDG